VSLSTRSYRFTVYLPPVSGSLLLDYHCREAKPVWWWFFQRLQLTESELIEDAESIGGMKLVGERDEDRHAYEYAFRFPVQQHRIDVGDSPVDPFTGKGAGTVVAVGDESLRLRRGKKVDRPLPRALIPGGAFDTRCQREALARIARSPGRYPALELVRRRDAAARRRARAGERARRHEAPRRARRRQLSLRAGPARLGEDVDRRAPIVHLLERGKRVGITATSHKAIHNMLDAIEDLERRGRAAEPRVPALPQPPERRGVARAVRGLRGREPAPRSRSTAARSSRCGWRMRSACSRSCPTGRSPGTNRHTFGANGGSAPRHDPCVRRPTVRQIYALAAALCTKVDEPWPETSRDASELIGKLRREIGHPHPELGRSPPRELHDLVVDEMMVRRRRR